MHLDHPRNHIVVGNVRLIGALSQIGPGRETKTKSVNNMPCGISLQYLKSHISTLISQHTYQRFIYGHQIFAWNIKFQSALFT